MSRLKTILSFTRFSLRDLLVTAGPTALIILVLVLVAYKIVDPEPPRHVRLATGQENGAFEAIGKRYAAALAKQGIRVELVRSEGSLDNLQKLNRGEVDIGFVQSGSTTETEADREGLVSLGSLFVEPVWVFTQSKLKISNLAHLQGLRINVGPEGTGVPRLMRQILNLNNVDPASVQLGALDNSHAAAALINGEIDGMVFAAAPEDLMIQMLLRTPGISLLDFTRAEAYARRLPFLTHEVLPRGIVDLGADLPAADTHLIAPTATLVAREHLHPALIELFVQAAGQIHSGAGWFQHQGQFPSPRYSEIPVAEEAAKFYKNGAPLLQRYMSFWMANFLDRMWVIIVALGALIIPLSRVVPPLYVWRVRSRIYRWYGQLRVVEKALEDGAAERGHLRKRLDHIEAAVNALSVPLSFADQVYELKSHIHFVRARIDGAPLNAA
ncbi:TAXI family TRAP transporter solute-binding subunit [Massilia sp. TS11]|uniref:TAXI family TRAP transporter solute-binding subunit n=1 Tax=Massilia sp. TS11 TaxID=2908003 RepID=UPI001EDAE8E6|nr:TAXI family TRAP transporter solute-binding subunit [Massilia sp. TS11]MCG2586004.1 ABC transporter substrate-binding protein [Massilia sp. TS11]